MTADAKKFQYRGSLRETALPEMLYSIDRFRVPGVIEARLGDVMKRVSLRDGYVFHASSNDLRDSLGEFLVRTEKLDKESHERIDRLRAEGKKRVGVLLIEESLLSPREVYRAIRAHIEEIVWSLFYWKDGEVTFAIGETANENMIQIRLPMRRVILEGIKRAPEAKPLVERVGKRETILEPSYRGEDLIELGLDRQEYEVLRAVDGKKTFYELCSNSHFAAADTAKLLYAFQVLHLVQKHDPERKRTGRVKIQMKSPGDVFRS